MHEGSGAESRTSVREIVLTRLWVCDACAKRIPKGDPARVHMTPGEGRNRVYHVKCDPPRHGSAEPLDIAAEARASGAAGPGDHSRADVRKITSLDHREVNSPRSSVTQKNPRRDRALYA